MERAFSASRWLAGAALVFAASLGACSKQDALTEKAFIGKWQSSKASAPIRLDENGEWELLTKDGSVVQYGVWQYFDNRFMWSITLDGKMRHDVNAVVSANPKEFSLRESDGSVTTFTKLN